VDDVASRCAELLYAATEYVAAQEGVMAVWSSDDMGFKNQPFASPDVMRKYFLAVHKRMAATAHAADKPYMLHSCGNLETIMEDLIEDVGVDAKHSFEDAFEPVADFKRRYGTRIAALGGVDMDVLARRTPEYIRACTRKILEDCSHGGAFAVGSGNTVANYIPPENYLAMLQAWNEFNGRG
jgi:uroporphyrinogen decarboxylase